jgi:uncharacterized protein involved in exopolysaccharide biosynthesis
MTNYARLCRFGITALDPRRFLQVIRRYGILVGITAAAGRLAGTVTAAVSPVTVTSTALVVLPQAAQSTVAVARGEPDPFTITQEVIADAVCGVLTGVIAAVVSRRLTP